MQGSKNHKEDITLDGEDGVVKTDTCAKWLFRFIFPKYIFKYYYEKKESWIHRDAKRSPCRGCYGMCMLLLAIFSYLPWTFLRVPIYFAKHTLKCCNCCYAQCCMAWLSAIAAFMVGFIFNIIYVPLAMMMTILWVIMASVECCCGPKKAAKKAKV